MLNTLIQEELHTSERFQNWFWFMYSKSVQNGFHQHRSSIKRPCEILDIETLVTKLYLSGKLTDEQLNVMKKFGDKRRAPHQYIYSENKYAAYWKSAMETLEYYAKRKGWLAD